jgi:hypothetical protein
LGVRFVTFALCIVRPAFAATIMAVVVVAAGRWLTDAGAPRALTAEVATGVIIYTTMLLIAWLVAGRPDGPETDALTFMQRIVTRS